MLFVRGIGMSHVGIRSIKLLYVFYEDQCIRVSGRGDGGGVANYRR